MSNSDRRAPPVVTFEFSKQVQVVPRKTTIVDNSEFNGDIPNSSLDHVVVPSHFFEKDKIPTEPIPVVKSMQKDTLKHDDVARANQINKGINDVCNNCCSCFYEALVKFFEKLFPWILQLFEQIYILILRPVFALVTNFFYGPDNKLFLWQPVYNGVMVAVNPIIVSLELILPINPGGGCGFPFVALIGRFIEWLDMLTSFRHLCSNDKENWTVSGALWHTFVGILSCGCALLCALYYAIITYGLVRGNSSYITFNISDAINTLKGYNDNFGVIILLLLVAQVGAFNGYTTIKNLFLHDLKTGWLKYKEILILDKVERNSNWYFIDVISRTLEVVASIPAYIYSLSNTNIGHLTVLKGYILHNSTIQNMKAYGKKINIKKGACCYNCIVCCGWAEGEKGKKDIIKKNDECYECWTCCGFADKEYYENNRTRNVKEEIPRMKETIMRQYEGITGIKHIVESKYNKVVNHNNIEWREQKWINQCRDNYIINRVNYQAGSVLVPPVLPLNDPPPPYSLDWYDEAVKDENVKVVLSEEIDVNNCNLVEKLNNYNNVMYNVYYIKKTNGYNAIV
jgi:hypothetical protein